MVPGERGDLERVQTVFTGLAAHQLFSANLATRGQTMNADGVLVSGSYVPTLRVPPALGRLLAPADDVTPGAHPLVGLSHAFWVSHFGASPNVLSEVITVNGQAMTVIGVAARGFEGTTLGATPRIFVPITMRAAMIPGRNDFENRRSYWAYLFARLKPGGSLEQAQAALATHYRSIITEVEAPLQTGMSDLFKTRGVALMAGRDVTRADALGAPKVAIVNQAVARTFNLGDHAVGARMSAGRAAAALDLEIVGLVRDAKYNAVKDAVPPQFFTPCRQDETAGASSFYVRTAGDATAVLASGAGGGESARSEPADRESGDDGLGDDEAAVGVVAPVVTGQHVGVAAEHQPGATRGRAR